MKEVRRENKWLVHGLFCLLVVLILLAGTVILQAQGFRLGSWTVLFVRYIFFIVCIYVGRWICNRWFPINKLSNLIIYLLITFIGIAVTWWLIVRFMLGFIHAGIWEIVFSATPFFAIGLVSGFILTLIRITNTLQVKQARAQMEQKQTELDLLQSQLSPHFLFNTLNNLYGISLTQHERVPKLLLQLSDLLRYAVYDNKNELVGMEEEIKYIDNFIDFERIRISDRLVLEINFEDMSGKGIRVLPMVLIVFIENAFKHAKDSFDEKIFISIRLYLENGELVFIVENSYHTHPQEPSNLESRSGMGLANTIRRLELLYTGKYKLIQEFRDKKYFVELRLPILVS